MPEMLTPKDVAKILQIGYESALAFIKYSGVDFLKIGNKYRISKDKLDAFIRAKGSKYIIHRY